MARPRPALPQEQLNELTRLYAQGHTMQSLAERFACSIWKVHSVIKTTTGARPRGRQTRAPSAADHNIRRLYETGLSAAQVAQQVGGSPDAVRAAVLRAGGTMRGSSEAHALAAPTAFTAEQSAELVARHAAGESCRTIASSLGADHKVVAAAIRRAGGNTRSRHQAVQLRRHDITGQTFGRLTALRPLPKARWEFQCSCGNIHVTLSDPVTRGLAKSCGCLRTGGDTLEQVIDGTLRNANDTAEFYVYNLAHHHGFLKPGIDSTGARADAQYGDQLLSIELTRIDAWLLEQAVLHHTRPLAAFPPALHGWAGYTELRRMPSDDLLALAANLHEQLLDLGRYAFALQFVPMTADQAARITLLTHTAA